MSNNNPVDDHFDFNPHYCPDSPPALPVDPEDATATASVAPAAPVAVAEPAAMTLDQMLTIVTDEYEAAEVAEQAQAAPVEAELLPPGLDDTKRLGWFDARGIPIDWAAEEVNARGIGTDPAEWPEGLGGFAADSGGAIRFDYASLAEVGGIGADGYTRSAGRADSDDPNVRRLDLSVLEGATDEEKRNALRRLVMAPTELFADPTWAMLAFGNLAWAECGAVCEGATYLLGLSNVGKSQRQTVLARMLGPAYGLETIIGANDKVGSDFALGAQNTLCIPDDFAGEGDGASRVDKNRETMIEILEMIARRAGGGEGEANGRRVKKERRGKWVQGEGDKAWVAFAPSGEEFPAELRYSSKMRFITVEVGERGWTKPDPVTGEPVDHFDEWARLATTPTLRLANAAFIEIVASRINRTGGMVVWQEELRQKRKAETEWLKEHNTRVDKKLNRPFIVAAGRLAGWVALVGAAKSVGAVTADEAAELIQKARRCALAAMETHYERFLVGENGRLTGEQLRTLIMERIASGEWRISSEPNLDTEDRTPVVGYMMKPSKGDGPTHVMLIAAAVAKCVGVERRKVLPALRELVGTPDADGSWTRQVRLGSGRVDGYWVPIETWD